MPPDSRSSGPLPSADTWKIPKWFPAYEAVKAGILMSAIIGGIAWGASMQAKVAGIQEGMKAIGNLATAVSDLQVAQTKHTTDPELHFRQVQRMDDIERRLQKLELAIDRVADLMNR